MVREKKKALAQSDRVQQAVAGNIDAATSSHGSKSVVKSATAKPHVDQAISLCVPSSDAALLKSLVEACGLSVVLVETLWDGSNVGFGTAEQSLHELPTRLLGFLTVSDTGLQQVERLRSDWKRQFNRDAPIAMSVRQPVDEAAVLGWIARELVSAQLQMAQRNVALLRDMYVLRADHEAMQEAFQRLENYTYASSTLARQLALSLEPQKSTIKVGKGDSGELRQLLPTSSVGICDVAFHVAHVPKDAQGQLIVTLQTLEDGQTVSKWTLVGSQIRLGWLQLGLEQALSSDDRSIALLMQWKGSGELRLSLSEPHPEPRWCAAVGGKYASGPLGVKLWRSFPGARAMPAVHAKMNVSAEQQSRMLYADTLRTVENLGAIPDGISFDEHWNSLLVHPVAGRTTWARLRGALPAGVTRICADIETRNEKAGPVEYAIAIAPGTDKARNVQSLQFKPEVVSEWIRVDTSMQSQVHLNLDAAAVADFDLYFGTRLPSGASNAFCWAHFSKIKLSS